MEVTDGVYAHGLDWQYDEPLWVHVLKRPHATVLFGGGDESTAEQLVDLARDHGVDAVVVEHGDGDHFGGVPALREALDVEVAVPAGDADLLREAGIEPDVELTPTDEYHGVDCISAPGHTPDNMAYLAEGTLVAGDTVAGSDSMFAAEGSWTGPLAPMTADFNADDAQARESIPPLLEYDFEHVLVAHGSSVLSDGHGAVATLVEELD
jgi:glyoxylase-like metal-dependent hydrolase (beta-lactamase superfamily II)